MSNPFRDARARRKQNSRKSAVENRIPVVVWFKTDDRYIKSPSDLPERERTFGVVKTEIKSTAKELIKQQNPFIDVDPREEPNVESIEPLDLDIRYTNRIEENYRPMVFWVDPNERYMNIDDVPEDVLAEGIQEEIRETLSQISFVTVLEDNIDVNIITEFEDADE